MPLTVSPAYASGVPISYAHGLTPTNQGDRFLGYSTSGGTEAGMLLALQKWRTSPGVKRIKRVTFRAAGLLTRADGIYFTVYKKLGSGDFEQLASVLLATTESTDTTSNFSYNLAPLVVTLPDDGSEIFYAPAFARPDGSASGFPGVRGQSSAASDNDSYLFSLTGVSSPPATVGPTAGRAPASGPINTAHLPSVEIEYESDSLVEWDSGSAGGFYTGTTKALVHPRPTSEDGTIRLTGVVVTDGNALTVECKDSGATSMVTSQTLVHDMGATDQVTFGGVNVALPTVDGASQAGHTFDYAIQCRDGQTKGDVFWQNLTRGTGAQSSSGGNYRDIQTISHKAKASGARGGSYTFAGPRLLRFSGTGTVARMQVGVRMPVMLGDSQTGTKAGSTADAALHRLGSAVPAALDKPHLVPWNAGIAGGRIGSDIAGFSSAGTSRFKHATPGSGDLCEFTNVVLFVNGFGLNSMALAQSDAGATLAAGNGKTDIASIVEYAKSHGNRVVVIGLPPYSASGISQWAATAVRRFNSLLVDVAIANECPCDIPWSETVDPATTAAAVPTFFADYTEDGGTHYNTTGAGVAAVGAVYAYEHDSIDLDPDAFADLYSGVLTHVYSTPAGSIRLSWTASGGGVAPLTYSLYRDGILIAGSVSSPYDDAELLAPGVVYEYQLRTTDSVETVVNSNTVSAGLPYDGTGGTPFLLDPDDVREGVDRGDGVLGTLVVPAAEVVLDGVTFDNGTVGELAAGLTDEQADQLDGLASTLLLVKAKTDRIGTGAGAVVNNAGVTDGGDITIRKADTWQITLTVDDDLSDCPEVVWTLKRHENDSDEKALAQISKTGGLLALNGETPDDPSLGSMGFEVTAAGVVLYLHQDATATLCPRENCVYDLKTYPVGDAVTVREGIATIEGTVTWKTA